PASPAPTPVVSALSDLHVVSVSVPPSGLSGEKVVISWTVENLDHPVWSGTTSWTDEVYISADPTFIPGRAKLLGSFPQPNTLGPGGQTSYTQTREVTLPRGIGSPRDPGHYHIYVVTN